MSNESKILGLHIGDGFIVRPIDLGDSICEKSFDHIVEAAEIGRAELELRNVTFITVVGASVFQAVDDDGNTGGSGFAMYHPGVAHLCVAAGGILDEFDNDERAYFREVRKSVFHEMAHQYQDERGNLVGDDRDEDEADQIAERLLDMSGWG